MSKHVIHQHSSVADKRPSASSLEYGEIAVNYASGKEAVMLRNTEDAVVTISSDVQNDSKFATKTDISGLSSQITDIEQNITAISGQMESIGECGHVGEVYPGSTSGEVFNDYETNIASGDYSHAEGRQSTASGRHSHAEGWGSTADGNYSHAEGSSCVASGNVSHAEGNHTSAIASYSHTEGYYTVATNAGEHACGRYNKSDDSINTSRQTRFSVGIGTSSTVRKNAIEAKANGDVYIYGVGGFDGQNDADDDVLPIGEALPSIVVTSAVPSTLASNTIYFIY